MHDPSSLSDLAKNHEYIYRNYRSLARAFCEEKIRVCDPSFTMVAWKLKSDRLLGSCMPRNPATPACPPCSADIAQPLFSNAVADLAFYYSAIRGVMAITACCSRSIAHDLDYEKTGA